MPQNGARFSFSGIFGYFVWGFLFFAKKLCQLVDGNAPMLLVCCWILKKNLYYSLLESTVWRGKADCGMKFATLRFCLVPALGTWTPIQVKLQQKGWPFSPTEKNSQNSQPQRNHRLPPHKAQHITSINTTSKVHGNHGAAQLPFFLVFGENHSP